LSKADFFGWKARMDQLQMYELMWGHKITLKNDDGKIRSLERFSWAKRRHRGIINSNWVLNSNRTHNIFNDDLSKDKAWVFNNLSGYF